MNKSTLKSLLTEAFKIGTSSKEADIYRLSEIQSLIAEKIPGDRNDPEIYNKVAAFDTIFVDAVTQSTMNKNELESKLLNILTLD